MHDAPAHAAGWARIQALDVHVGGEPLRIVTGGVGEIPGATMLEKRRHARARLDGLRRAVLLEPRGHADMYGCIPTAPVTPDGDAGCLFLHSEGFSTMCGHGVVGFVTAALECGLLRPRDRSAIRLDTPAGRVVARAELDGERVRAVSFRNVPSFVLASGLALDVPGLGRLTCDLAFGGAFYAYVDAAPLGLALEPAELARLIDLGRSVARAVERAHPPRHPDGVPDLDFVYGTIFVGPARGAAHSRNVCVFGDGQVDRSPTGTGVSGRAALHFARGELAVGASLCIESLLGTTFNVRVVATTTVGTLPAVVPEVRGSAHLTGTHEFWLDPEDPLAGGFLLR